MRMETVKHRGDGEEIAGNLDTSLLKVLALVFMLIDHLGAIIFPGISGMRIIGRMAFPLYAWCLVVGSDKTHNIYRYGLRLLLLGVVAQPLYMMALNHTWAEMNILFSLFIGLVAIYGIQKRFCFSQIWVPALCYVALGFLKVDYGWKGLTFILVLYGARKNRSGLVAAYMAYALFWGSGSMAINEMFGYPLSFLGWVGLGTALASLFRLQGMIWLALPLVAIPTHSNVRMPQWLGYALYPMHFLLIILLRLTVKGVAWGALFQGF